MQSTFSPRAAAPVIRTKSGEIFAPSSFGLDHTTFGPGFNPSSLLEGERYRGLDYRHKFACSQQHDWKTYDASGRVIRPGTPFLSQPLIGGLMPSFYVPLDQRRPDSPYRIARLIVRRFTSLIFGHGRCPKLTSPDPDTEALALALEEAGSVPAAFAQARNLGGGMGSVGISWRFWEGKPRLKVHLSKHLYVHAWADREQLVPEHVSELYQTARDVWNPEKRRMERRLFWVRSDWTPIADLTFCEVPVTNEAVEWVIDEYAVHDDGEAHFIWVRNLPSDEDPGAVDGECDYEGLFEPMNSIDTLSTVINRGAKLNLDPTLVLQLDPDLAKRGVRKGSDNALSVGEQGDAKYLELQGTSIQAGLALRNEERKQILEVAQVVVPDPDEVTAAGTSSLAIRLLYQPMLDRSDLLRTTWGAAYVQLMEQMLRSARRLLPERGEDGSPLYPIEVDEEGNELEVRIALDLPPRVIEEQQLDEKGQPTGKTISREEEHHPGKIDTIKLVWPAYFPETENERQQRMQSLTTATGGKAVLSQRTATELAANVYGVDAAAEAQRVAEDAQRAAEREGLMFPPMGGELPSAAGAGDVVISVNDRVNLYTANELRAFDGKGPIRRADGSLDPDGFLLYPEFKAKRSAVGEVLGDAVGQAKAADILPAAQPAAAPEAPAPAASPSPPPEQGSPPPEGSQGPALGV